MNRTCSKQLLRLLILLLIRWHAKVRLQFLKASHQIVCISLAKVRHIKAAPAHTFHLTASSTASPRLASRLRHRRMAHHV